MWTILFWILAALALNACSDTNNVSGPQPLSPDAQLSTLTITPGTLQPAFSGDVANYSVEVATSVTSVTVTAQPQNAGATVSINGQTATSQPVSLGAPGSSTSIPIVVTAVSGSQNTYIATVNRTALGGNNNLQSLTVSSGSLVPSFTASTTSYTVDVATSVTSVTVTARAQDPGASVSINGQPTTSLLVTLSGAGTNTPISIVVTAPNGSQKPYLVTVNRAAPGGNNNLQSLSVSPGSLAPAFMASRLVYTVNVASDVGSVTVTAQPQDGGATVNINGQTTTNLSVPLGAAGSSTEILIDVIAPDGRSQKTYAVTVNRAAPVLSGNNNLSGLVVSAGPLVPSFDPATTNYDVLVPVGTDTTVTATVAESTATLTINGLPATSGVPSASIPLAQGKNLIFIVVTAENGSTKTYTVTVTRIL